MKDEDLKLALEALEHLQPTALNSFYTIGARDKAITAIKQYLAASVQKGAIGAEYQKSPWDEKGISMPPPEAPDLQAELDATNRQVEILCDALAKSRRQRQWVGLTDEQIDLFINGRGDEDDDDYVEPTGDGFGLTDADLVKLVRRAEAKLRSENT